MDKKELLNKVGAVNTEKLKKKLEQKKYPVNVELLTEAFDILESNDARLTQYELNFYETVKDRFDNGQSLSEKQCNYLLTLMTKYM